MKRFHILLISVVLLVILFFVVLSNKNHLSDRIIKFIDNNYDENNICILRMKEITDFKWDKMLIYQVGSSETAISEALGVEYKDSVDLMSGIVFVYENKIIYKQSIPYNPDHPSELLLFVGDIFREPNYRVFTPDDASFEGSRWEKNGQFYYKIVPITLKKPKI